MCNYQTLYNTKSKNKRISIDKDLIFNEFNDLNKMMKEKSDANRSLERDKKLNHYLFKSSSASNIKDTKRNYKITDSTCLGLSIKNGTISSGSNLNYASDSNKFI